MAMNRRTFLRSATASVSAGGITYFLPEFPALRADDPPAPSDRIRFAAVGVGGQGKGNLAAHAKDCVAVCDVDTTHLAAAVAQVEKASGKAPEGVADYRKILDRKDVDAVIVSTPDHWHAQITVDACHAGKDVYCEKPLTLTIAEGRKIVDAARKNKRIVQTGSQQRSDAKFRQACELVRSGRLGKITEVKVGIPGVNFKGPAVEDGKPPAELDYDRWLGPAPERAYNEKRVHYLFRFFWDYSGGQLTNFGAHHLDIMQWALGMDESGPITIEGKARYHKDDWYETPEWCEIVYTYANGTKATCGMAEKGGCTFIGEKGTLFVTRGKIESTLVNIFKEPRVDTDVKLYVSADHHKNWVECIRSRKLPICDAEIGHRSATVCHLGNIAARLQAKITWDPAKEVVVGNEKAQAMTERPYRAPWKLT